MVDGTGKGDPKFTIADETYAMKHNDRGILAMANNGTSHSASSQVQTGGCVCRPLAFAGCSSLLFRDLSEAPQQVVECPGDAMMRNKGFMLKQ